MVEENKNNIVVKTNIGLKELYEFTMNNNYKSIHGVISVLFSIASAIGGIVFWNQLETWQRVGVIVFALMFTVIEPIEYYFRCKKQVKKNFTKPLIYTFSENGIEIEQGENSAKADWNDIMKVTSTKNLVTIYLSPIRAFILPKDNLTQEFEELKNLMKHKVNCYKFNMKR